MFSKICIKRPVTTIMVLLIVLMAGIVSVFSLKLDLMPNIDLPVAIVSTTYVGAGPDEIEKLVTKPLEDALGTVSSVDKITSVSSDNSSMVIVQFVDGTDIDMAAIDMREKVDLVKSSLPDDADDPMVLKLDVTAMSSIVVGLESDSMDLKTLNSLVEDSISDSYEKIDGVASVTSIGGIEEEVQIVVDPEKLEGYGLTESSISQVLAAENLNMQDLSSINITSPVTGGAVPLSEVADIVNSESSVSVSREDHHKYIDIEADVDGRDLQSVQKDIDAKLQQYNFQNNYGVINQHTYTDCKTTHRYKVHCHSLRPHKSKCGNN
jgi:hydrophobic/amphiphilic exporter-1 (mainly G- bacteria), HAE1 family